MRGRAARRVESDALLVRTVAYGESDVIATLFTREEGKVYAIVRGGRKSTRRVGGALEPMHTMRAAWEDRATELVTLKEARVVRVRAGLTARLEALDAAGKALRWVRHVCPPRTPEPGVWEAITRLLDALDRGDAPEPALAVFGLALVGEIGWAPDLERCVRCGKLCPADRPAAFDAARGGLVCQSCGGAPRVMGPPVRALALACMHTGRAPEDAPAAHWAELLAILGEVMAAHAGVEA